MNGRGLPRRHQGRSDKVVRLFPSRPASSPFDQLTTALIVKQFREGALPEGVLLSLLAASGVGTGGGHER